MKTLDGFCVVSRKRKNVTIGQFVLESIVRVAKSYSLYMCFTRLPILLLPYRLPKM